MLQHNHHQRQFVGNVRNWTWSFLNSECAASMGQITPEAGSAVAVPNSSSSCAFKFCEMICVFPPRERRASPSYFTPGIISDCLWFGKVVKNPPAMQETQEMLVWLLGQEDLLEEQMAAHSNILAWEILRMEKPSGLQSTGSKIVRHDWATACVCDSEEPLLLSRGCGW